MVRRTVCSWFRDQSLLLRVWVQEVEAKSWKKCVGSEACRRVLNFLECSFMFQKPRVPKWPTLLQPQSTVYPLRVSGLRRTCLLRLPSCAHSCSLEHHQALPIANWRRLYPLVSENAFSQDPCGMGVTCFLAFRWPHTPTLPGHLDDGPSGEAAWGTPQPGDSAPQHLPRGK